MPAADIVSASEVAPERLHAAFVQAFADYLIGPFRTPLDQWPRFLARQGVDVSLSRATLAAGEVTAFCLVAPRPEGASWRLGTLGALPAARGSGAAPALLHDFLARAKGAGREKVELECFVQNARALRLYEKHGFRTVDTLYGYRRQPVAGRQSGTGPTVVPLEDAFAWLEGCLAAGIALPLQVTPRSLRALTVPLQAWRQGSGQLIFSHAGDGVLHVHALVDRNPAQQDAGALAAALLSHHPQSPVDVPQLQRQAVGGAALERLGFERHPLHQVWMTALI